MKEIRSSLKKIITNQRGNVLVIVTGAILLMFGFSAIVVDGGSLYLEKSRLQKKLDAAVLGGAKGLLDSESDAISIAKTVASENGLTLKGNANLSAPNYIITGTNYIEIKQTINKDMTFAKVLGIAASDVSAIARAELKSGMVEAENAIPLGLPKTVYKYGESYNLVLEPGKGLSGNYQYLAPSRNDGKGQGANVLEDAIKYGVPIGKKEFTEPGSNGTNGNGNGPAASAFKYRLEADKNNPDCLDWQKANSTCKRFVIVPLIESLPNGRKEVDIVGFAAFWLEGYSENHKTVTGKFIKMLGKGNFEEGNPNYGVYTIKLVK